jgi:hypothetical protein
MTVYLRPEHNNTQHHCLWIPNTDSIVELCNVVFSKTAEVDHHADNTMPHNSITSSEASDSKSGRTISHTNSSKSTSATTHSSNKLSTISDTELDEPVSNTANNKLNRFAEDIDTTDSKLHESASNPNTAGSDLDKSVSSVVVTNGKANRSTSTTKSFTTTSNTKPSTDHIHNNGASHSLPRLGGEWVDYQPKEDNLTMPSLINGSDDKDNSDDNDKSDGNSSGASSGGDTIIGLSDQVLDLGTQGDYNVIGDTDWMPANKEQAALCQRKPIA